LITDSSLAIGIMTSITFAGAADTVTGSRFLLKTSGHSVMLDCGLFQGVKTLRDRNWAPPSFTPADIDAVLLSHAHLDHSGYLPVLVREGFQGNIYASAGTCDLVPVMLLDSAHLMEEEARHANQYGYSKHTPARPLYTVNDAIKAINHLKPVHFNEKHSLGSIQYEFIPAGHLLGAATLRLQTPQGIVVYSGDLGRSTDVLMHPPQIPDAADMLIVESTYGNRKHPSESAHSELLECIKKTIAHGGKVIMPSFAVGRAQALLIAIHRAIHSGELPSIPVYLDSPMAARATTIYNRHAKQLKPDSQEWRRVMQDTQFLESVEDSIKLTRSNYPCIIIAGSGMATGGRVLHHIKAFAGDARNHIVFPGFQVPGTRGAKMVSGERTIRLMGQDITIRAHVSQIEGFSGHADADEIMQWIKGIGRAPKQIYVVHGEREAADVLRWRIRNELGIKAQAVEHMQTVEL
jgi:metallo-beta-lactamase family protein